MAERLIEVVLDSDPRDRLSKILEEISVIAHWSAKLDEDMWQTKILLLAENSEKILDTLAREFSSNPSFRVVIIPVEASIPRVEEDKEEKEKQQVEDKPIFKRISREELYQDISASISNNAVDLVMVVLSAIVATIGLVRNSPSIVVGAMVIAPMLGPNVAQAFATTLGDSSLAFKAIRTNLIRIGLGFIFSLFVGFFLRVEHTIPEISSRTVVDFGDIILAFSSGTAAALSMTSGLATSLIGVMVAASLLPPLATSGILLGNGNLQGSLNALLLFFVNIVCVNLSSTITFRLQGLGPRTWWEANKAGKAVKVALIGWFILLSLLAFAIFLDRGI